LDVVALPQNQEAPAGFGPAILTLTTLPGGPALMGD
jgi:hypothetical protein